MSENETYYVTDFGMHAFVLCCRRNRAMNKRLPEYYYCHQCCAETRMSLFQFGISAACRSPMQRHWRRHASPMRYHKTFWLSYFNWKFNHQFPVTEGVNYHSVSCQHNSGAPLLSSRTIPFSFRLAVSRFSLLPFYHRDLLPYFDSNLLEIHNLDLVVDLSVCFMTETIQQHFSTGIVFADGKFPLPLHFFAVFFFFRGIRYFMDFQRCQY